MKTLYIPIKATKKPYILFYESVDGPQVKVTVYGSDVIDAIDSFTKSYDPAQWTHVVAIRRDM
jgi:hypothetical protein